MQDLIFTGLIYELDSEQCLSLNLLQGEMNLNPAHNASPQFVILILLIPPEVDTADKKIWFNSRMLYHRMDKFNFILIPRWLCLSVVHLS